MATEVRKMRDSGKKSNKDGKHNKTFTAEEEARRREEIEERLREKLELEKRALKVVERLLEDRVTEDFLVDCAKFITAANYKDIIEERSIAKLCGYPLCPNKLGKIPTQQYKISTKTNKVYDITERKCFCCNFCYKASKEFELQIPKASLWLRQHESPEEIKLLKKGCGGSSGEEVKLTETRLKEEDIENPPAPHAEDPHSSQQPPREAPLSSSDISDGEQEQDFVSSVVMQQQRPRVHWGDQPKTINEGKRVGKTERRKKKEGQMAKQERKEEVKTEAEEAKSITTDQDDEPTVGEVSTQINLCRLSDAVSHDASLPADVTPTHVGHAPASLPQLTDPVSSTLNSTNDTCNNSASPTQPGLDITQVGMSRRGGAGLRDLLKNHTDGTKPDSVRLTLLEYLKGTLRDWCTAETLTFLYGDGHPISAPQTDLKKEDKEEEELDEDDLDDETEVNFEGTERPSTGAPDYKRLQRDTEQLELQVKEFYKGPWTLPEEVRAQEHSGGASSSLPLTDSQAQHLIQKRIVVEKLTSCLRNIAGPLRLAMSDVSTHLNNLVRTFRLTNTNIIHKTPLWTLIAVVLLHLLSEVSPGVREAVQRLASVEYLNTLMKELGLCEQDLLNLVQLFKSPTH